MNSNYCRIFKYIGFILNHYISIINLDVMLFCIVFSKFVFGSQLDV